MTTNAGAADMAKQSIGFGRGTREGEDEEAINRLWHAGVPQPAGLGHRLKSLTPPVMHRVLEKSSSWQLEFQLEDRKRDASEIGTSGAQAGWPRFRAMTRPSGRVPWPA